MPIIQKNKDIQKVEKFLLRYFGLSIHKMTKSEKIFHILDSLGISVSYEHVIKLENVACIVIDPSSSSTQDHLPEDYSNVLAVTTNVNEVVLPAARTTNLTRES